LFSRREGKGLGEDDLNEERTILGKLLSPAQTPQVSFAQKTVSFLKKRTGKVRGGAEVKACVNGGCGLLGGEGVKGSGEVGFNDPVEASLSGRGKWTPALRGICKRATWRWTFQRRLGKETGLKTVHGGSRRRRGAFPFAEGRGPKTNR